MKQLIILLSLFIGLTSCEPFWEKDKLRYTYISGVLLDDGNNEPVPNAIVVIQDGVANSGEFTIDAETKGIAPNDTTYTDENGWFEIDLESTRWAYLYFKKESYRFSYSIEGAALGIAPIDEGEHRDMEFKMTSKSKLNCFFNPIFQTKKEHQLNYQYLFFSSKTGAYSKTGLGFKYLGTGPFYTDMDILWANRNIILDMDYTNEQGEWVNQKDTIFVSAHEAYTDTIWYGN